MNSENEQWRPNDVNVGDRVSVLVDPRINNSETIAAGIVTKAVSQPGDHDVRVNVRVFLDTGDDLRLTNVMLLESKPDLLGAHNGNLAFWPSRD